jgi:transcriptional regulator with XRE-family HTH domain
VSTLKMIKFSKNGVNNHYGGIIILSDVSIICMEIDALADLGEKIKKRRKDRGWTQSELVERLNQSPYHPDLTGQSHVSNIENGVGDKLPSVRMLAALAEVLETNTDYLLGLTNDDKPASDLEDQVVVGVHDRQAREAIQELADLMASRPPEEQQFVLSVVRRLIPKQPRIIGG